MAAAGILKADLGRVLLINIVVAGSAMIGGLLWATLYCNRFTLPYDEKLRREIGQDPSAQQHGDVASPSIVGAFAPIMVPLTYRRQRVRGRREQFLAYDDGPISGHASRALTAGCTPGTMSCAAADV